MNHGSPTSSLARTRILPGSVDCDSGNGCAMRHVRMTAFGINVGAYAIFVALGLRLAAEKII